MKRRSFFFGLMAALCFPVRAMLRKPTLKTRWIVNPRWQNAPLELVVLRNGSEFRTISFYRAITSAEQIEKDWGRIGWQRIVDQWPARQEINKQGFADYVDRFIPA